MTICHCDEWLQKILSLGVIYRGESLHNMVKEQHREKREHRYSFQEQQHIMDLELLKENKKTLYDDLPLQFL